MRSAYWELHVRGGHQPRSPVVLGRKHCAGCGHWRHVCDFGMVRGRLRSRCHACHRTYMRWQYANAAPDQVERRREYDRIWREVQRRRRGAPERPYRHTVIDRVERVFLPVEPLLTELERIENLEDFARLIGIGEKAIRRWRSGESARVRIDVADRVAVALGLTSSLIWEDW